MSNVDDSLPDEWAGLWHQDHPPSLTGLKRRIRRAELANRLAMLAELAVSCGGLAVGGWVAYGGNLVVGGAACAFSLLGLGLTLALRVDSPRDTDSVSAALDAATRQTLRQQRVGLGGIGLCAAALVFVSVVSLAGLEAAGQAPRMQRLVQIQALAGVFVAVMLVYVTLILWRSRQRLERQRNARSQI